MNVPLLNSVKECMQVQMTAGMVVVACVSVVKMSAGAFSKQDGFV